MDTLAGVLHSVDGVHPHDGAEGRIQNSPMGSPGSWAVTSDPKLSVGRDSADGAVATVLGTPKGSDRYETAQTLEIDADDRS